MKKGKEKKRKNGNILCAILCFFFLFFYFFLFYSAGVYNKVTMAVQGWALTVEGQRPAPMSLSETIRVCVRGVMPRPLSVAWTKGMERLRSDRPGFTARDLSGAVQNMREALFVRFSFFHV